MKKQHGFGIVEIIIVVVIVAGVGVGGWYLLQPRDQAITAPPQNQAQEPDQPQPQPTTKKYANTKYGYSFEYPAEAVIYADGPYGGEKLALDDNSDSITIEVGEKRVTVSATSYMTPDIQKIYQEFSSTIQPPDIVITEVTLGGGKGFKVTFKDPEYTAIYYFIHKQDGSPVLRMSASAGLASVLDSFKFE